MAPIGAPLPKESIMSHPDTIVLHALLNDLKLLLDKYTLTETVNTVPLNTDNVNAIQFYPLTRFESKCIKCGLTITTKQSVFVLNKKGWHVNCESPSNKQNHTFFQKCLKEGNVNP